MIPGEYIIAAGNIIANKGRKTVKLTVVNTGDRPVQIGSHFHFFETNVNEVTHDAFDPISREPNYKQCAVRVERTGAQGVTRQ